jgi:hypothetical protein
MAFRSFLLVVIPDIVSFRSRKIRLRHRKRGRCIHGHVHHSHDNGNNESLPKEVTDFVCNRSRLRSNTYVFLNKRH